MILSSPSPSPLIPIPIGTGADNKISWATTPLPPQPKKLPGGQQDQGPGVVLHFQGEVNQSTLTFRRRVAGYQENDALDPSSQKF